VTEERCRNCIHFQPHIFFPYIGYCGASETCVHEHGTCEKFKKVSLDELLSALNKKGGVYCITCGATIVDRSELENHSKGHRVVAEIVFDEAIAAEARSAD